MTYFRFYAISKDKLKKYVKLKENKNTVYRIFVAIIISIIFFLLIYMVIYNTNASLTKFTYGEHYNVTHSVIKEPPVNKSQLVALYDMLITNDFPYPVYFVNDFYQGPAIIYDGVVISNNSKPENITFINWGVPNNLNLYNFSGPHKNTSFFTIKGNTFDNPSGFMTLPINHSDRYVSLNLGSIYKYPLANQVTIHLNIVGELNNYNLFFVNGRLGIENWVNNNFYKKIETDSSMLVDLVELISSKADKFLYLNGISVNIEKNTDISSFPFRIDFGKSTINTPNILVEEDPFFVNGFIFEGMVISNNLKFLFNDWNIIQTLDQEFIVNTTGPYMLVPNNWDIQRITETKDNLTNDLYIKLESKRTIPLENIPILQVLPRLDIYNSMLQFGSSKDILFIIILVLLVTLAFQNREKII